MVVAPGSEGYLGILPHHTPLFTTLGPGVFRVKRGGVEEILAVFGGFMDVRADHVVVLTDVAEHAEEIDLRRAEESRERAQQVLAAGPSSVGGEERARAALPRAPLPLPGSDPRARRPPARPGAG